MKKPFIRKSWKKITALILCCMLILPVLSASADSIDELETKISELDTERAEIDATLDQLRDDESKKVEYQTTLEEKIELIEAQVTQARDDIDLLDSEILELETKLQKSEEEMGETLDLFYAKVKELYKAGTGSQLGTLEILLDAKNLEEYAFVNETLKSVNKHDEMVMEKIRVYMEETEEERNLLNEKKTVLAEKKVQLESDQAELDVLYEENAKALMEIKDLQIDAESRQSEINAEKEAYANALEEAIAEQKRLEEEARKAAEEAAAASGGGSSSGGNVESTANPSYDGSFDSTIWPMPGVYYVSQHYAGGQHLGIDIAGPYGSPIVAVESGQVIRAVYEGWGYGWGHHVMIYHNGTYSTLYAHMSDVVVSAGQTVEKGQIIGYEGSTGDSTGPHLHFEVYQNGSRINPWPFIGGR